MHWTKNPANKEKVKAAHRKAAATRSTKKGRAATPAPAPSGDVWHAVEQATSALGGARLKDLLELRRKGPLFERLRELHQTLKGLDELTGGKIFKK